MVEFEFGNYVLFFFFIWEMTRMNDIGGARRSAAQQKTADFLVLM